MSLLLGKEITAENTVSAVEAADPDFKPLYLRHHPACDRRDSQWPLWAMAFADQAVSYECLYHRWFERLRALLPTPDALLADFPSLDPLADEWRQMALDVWRSTKFTCDRNDDSDHRWPGGPPYRDHIVHPLAICLVGEDLISETPLGELTREWFQTRLARSRHADEDAARLAIWAWQTAALAHDLGYRLVWRLSAVLDLGSCFEGVVGALASGATKRVLAHASANCRRRGLHRRVLSALTRRRRPCSTRASCFGPALARLASTDTTSTKRPHGLLAAFELARSADRVRGSEDDIWEAFEVWSAACEAIALHDARPAAKEFTPIRLADNPLAFVLRLLDLLDEGGRNARSAEEAEVTVPGPAAPAYVVAVEERVPGTKVCAEQTKDGLALVVHYRLRPDAFTRTGYDPDNLIPDKIDDLKSLVDASGNVGDRAQSLAPEDVDFPDAPGLTRVGLRVPLILPT